MQPQKLSPQEAEDEVQGIKSARDDLGDYLQRLLAPKGWDVTGLSAHLIRQSHSAGLLVSVELDQTRQIQVETFVNRPGYDDALALYSSIRTLGNTDSAKSYLIAELKRLEEIGHQEASLYSGLHAA